jgi:hypothetical protein
MIWTVEVSIEIYEGAEGAEGAEEGDSLSRTVEDILTIGKENYIGRYCAKNRRSEFFFLIFIISSHIPNSLLGLILDSWSSEYRSVNISANSDILYTPLNIMSLIKSAEGEEKREEDEKENIFWRE